MDKAWLGGIAAGLAVPSLKRQPLVLLLQVCERANEQSSKPSFPFPTTASRPCRPSPQDHARIVTRRSWGVVTSGEREGERAHTLEMLESEDSRPLHPLLVAILRLY